MFRSTSLISSWIQSQPEALTFALRVGVWKPGLICFCPCPRLISLCLGGSADGMDLVKKKGDRAYLLAIGVLQLRIHRLDLLIPF